MAPSHSRSPFSWAFWQSLLSRIRGWRGRRAEPIASADSLGRFVRTRAAHVAQTSLYGYLRTRAGTRFPELFSDDPFVKSINIAKWHVWLACVSDLAVHAGGQIRRQSQAPSADIGALMARVVDGILAETGLPEEAGEAFADHAARVRSRIALCDWPMAPDTDAAFSQSPTALVHWAPVVDELKELDEEIVRNSIRFRWQEVRREMMHLMNADAVLDSVKRVGAVGEPGPLS